MIRQSRRPNSGGDYFDTYRDTAALNAWIAIEGAAFLRFETDLEVLAEDGAGPTRYHLPAIEFLRIPFRY